MIIKLVCSYSGKMVIDMEQLLYPEPWRDKETRYIRRENSLHQVRRIFKLIYKNAEPEIWEQLRAYIYQNGTRRSDSYLEIMNKIEGK